MVWTALAPWLVLVATPGCEARPDAGRPPPAVFQVLGGPVLGGLTSCPEGEIPAVPAAPPAPDLPPRPDREPDELDCAPQGCWAWAGWSDRRRMRGAAARLSIEVPAVTAPDHSLAEVALRWGSSDQEIVELGWEVAPRRHGDGEPHLFVHRWVHGRPCPSPCGFERWSPRLHPGQPLGRWKGRDLAVGWLLAGDRAWAWADGEWLGSFRLGTEGAPAVARVAQWFGEVFFVRAPPRVPMGAGLPGESPGAARITFACDVDEEASSCVARPERLPRVSAPDVYSLRTDGQGGFRYGGPAGPVRPRPPPSSASAGTLPERGTSAPSPPR